MKVALITGVTRQDGAYLSEFLLNKGYIVHGIMRRASRFNTDRADHLYQDPHVEKRNFILHYGDMTDSSNLIRLVKEIQPDEIYNLAAMRVSCTNPEKEVMVVDPKYFRPTEVDTLVGNATKENTKLSWVPEFDLEDLVREMVQADLKHMLRDKYLKGEGFETFNYFE